MLLVEGTDQVAKLEQIADKIPGVKRIVCVKPVPAAKDARVVAWSDWLGKTADAPAVAKLDGNALATIVYTSGTTGKPKGVMLSHQNMLQDAAAGLKAYEIFTGDVFLSFLPLSHMLERTVGYYLTMLAGSTVAFARSIAQLGEDFKSVRPTIMVSVPRMFEKLHAQMQCLARGGFAQQAQALRDGPASGLEPLRVAPGAGAVAVLVPRVAAAGIPGGEEAAGALRRAAAALHQRGCRVESAHRADLHRAGAADLPGLRAHGSVTRGEREPAGQERSVEHRHRASRAWRSCSARTRRCW